MDGSMEALDITLRFAEALEGLGVQDVLGVLKVQGQRLDLPYLASSAGQMSLEDLLQRALSEAGIEKK